MSNHSLAVAVCAAALCMGDVRTSGAADPEFVGMMSLVIEQKVANELGLSPTEYAEMFEWVDDRELDATDLVLSLKDQPEELAKRMEAFVKESERLGLAKLTPQQQAKLKQIYMQRRGMATLGDEFVRTQLKYSAEQAQLIDETIKKRAEALDEAREGERRIIEADYERRLAALLTEEQRDIWNKLAGTESKPEPPADVDDPVAAARGPQDGPQPPADHVGNGKKELRFNFRYAPWKTVLEWFAEQADYSLEMAATPPGTLNYSDNRVYTPAEAIDLLNGLLLFKGYTIIRHQRMLTVINLEDGIPPNLIETITVDDLDDRGKFELVSVLFPLDKLTPDEAKAEFEQLLGPQGSIVVLPKTNAVHVTETGGRLRAIRDLLRKAEKPLDMVDAKIHDIPLRFATAEEVLVVVRQLMQLPEDRNAAPDGSLSIAVDGLGTRLFITGDEDNIQQVKNIIELVDVDNFQGIDSPLLIETPQMEAYPITDADPESVLKVMQTIMAEQPGVRLDIDPKTGTLYALARPSQHQTIRATIDQMQTDSRVPEVFTLRAVDPQIAVLSINQMFGASEEGSNARAPIVNANPTTGMLMVYGTEAQIATIRQLLEKMGETWVDEETPGPYARGGNVRMIPLTGQGARNALEQIQALWPERHQNKIRVVRPSAAIRELRSGRDDFTPSGDLPPASELNNLFRLFQIQPRAAPNSSDNTNESGETAPPVAPTMDKDEPREEDTRSAGPRQASKADFSQSPFRLVADRTLYAQAQAPAERTSDEQPAPQKKDQPDLPESRPGADIIVAPGPGGILITSDDLDALDEFESLLQLLASQAGVSRDYTVFYLKYARAEVAGELLNEILGGSSGGTSGASGGEGGGLIGDLASAALGNSGGGLVGSLLGLGGGGGAITTSGTVSIVADSRLNALVVQANPADMNIVEQLLEIIDQEASPEDVQTFAKPRLIPVFYTSADEIANVVRQVYSGRIGGATQTNRQPSPEEFIRALRGGRGGSTRRARDEEQQVTIGVDQRSNSLVVSAPEPLFQEIRLLVEQLDKAGADETETIRVVTLKNASPQLVQQAIVSITGGKVTTNTSSTSDQPSNVARRGGDDNNDRTPQASQQFRDEMRRRIEAFNRLQREGGGFGRPDGGRDGPPSSRGGDRPSGGDQGAAPARPVPVRPGN